MSASPDIVTETPVSGEQEYAMWGVEDDFMEELQRLGEVVIELRHALAEALTCTAIWCMCESHELLRRTEGDEGPYEL